MAIGRVSVEVTPDARGFVAKMRGEILPAADRLGHDLGAKIGDQAGRTARERINAQLKNIKAHVNVDADTGKAQAQMAALRRETERTDRSASSAGAHYGILVKLLLAIGPALIPLGAAAAVGLGALVEGAGVALLAFKGIQDNMKRGTLLGRAYSGVLQVLKSDYHQLADTAAKGAFSGISDAVDSIHKRLPELSSQVKLFSGYLGRAAANVVDGILNGFVVLQPVITQILSGLVNMTARFDAWTKGGGLAKFGESVGKELPVIAKALGEIFGAIGKLIVAGNSIGLVYLNAFAAIARAISAIPTPVLRDILALFIALKVSMLAWGAATTVITAISTAVKGLAVAIAVESGVAKAAAVSNLTFGSSLGVIAGRLTMLIPLFGAFGAAALINIPLQSESKKPGGLGNIASGILGAVTGDLAGQTSKHLKESTGPGKDSDKKIKTLADAYSALNDAQIKQLAIAKKTQESFVYNAGAADNLTTKINALNDAWLNAASADTNFWQSLNTATKTLKSNRAAILGHSEAALADRSALESLTNAAQQDAIAKAKSTHNEIAGIIQLRQSKKAIEDKLRSQGLLTKAVQDYINKIFRIPKGALTIPLFKSQAAEDRLAAYLKKIHYVPGSKTTTFDARTGQAVTKIGNLLTLYNALTNKTVTVTVFGSADTGLRGPGHASGGWINGAGTSTSDSIISRLSNGEFVVPADVAAQNATYLEKITKMTGNTAANTSVARPVTTSNLSAPITINQVTDPAGTAYALQRRLAFAGRV
jgi:hypothetical protein